jgi:hypothetical protein
MLGEFTTIEVERQASDLLAMQVGAQLDMKAIAAMQNQL